MARLIASITPTSEIALAVATAKTVLQARAPTNQRVVLLRWGVFFDGVSVTGEPVQIELMFQTTDGTMTSITPKKIDGSLGETVQTTAGENATSEPTEGDFIAAFNVHPQQGLMIVYPLGQEPVMGGGDRIGIKCEAPAAVNCRPFMVVEE